MLRFPDRTLTDWDPDKAIAEAQRDIAEGAPKIYISGTDGAYAPGIGSTHNFILRKLRRADAGIGCTIDDMELRTAQFKYARRYNEYVVQRLSER